ncbi:WXG100 family type VII secretion target [Kitasatospora sp. NBC_01302]|uniref:WXG100 family type VII secretion target n=1 Tax=Kitasatospora sp. NBC_01302 TaxID=2903575 RepID=UPI002E0E8311|nr:hypothetical protein OG294_24200 [Kitasatospora sp. NBC_01302]
MAAKTPSALKAFANTWVGGDIHGLSALAGTLYGYAPQIDEAVTFLDTSVTKVAHDAGWTGSAASAFQQAWGTDSMAAKALESVISSAGDVIDTLAVNLASIESALEDGADQARKAGVAIGADGKPPAAAPTVGPPTPAEAAGTGAGAGAGTASEAVAGEYATLWAQSMQLAEDARVDAAGQLQQIYQQIAPPGSGGSSLTTSDKVTVGDYLRGLWAVPSAYSKTVNEQVEKLSKDAAAAKTAWVEAKNARPNPNVAMPQDAKDNLHNARVELASAQTDLTAAEKVESRFPLARKLDVRLSTFMTAFGYEAGASAERSLLDKGLKFGGDIPVLDAVAAAAGTVLGAEDDMHKGMHWYEAWPENALANVGSLAVGTAAGTAIGGAIAAGSFAGATVAGVAIGAVAGGAICVGVGDLTSNLFHEHWDEDIHKDGVLGGIGDGIGHSAAKTVSDLGSLAGNVGDLGKKLWHGIF